ncbi:MAG TPA: M14 family zinc carboxypeptidase [Paludibaculum sp.]|jgi:hypothetical protein
MRKFIASFVLLALSAAAQKFEFWPGAKYDPAIPTVEKVLGHEAGVRIAPHADIVRYFEALAAASPTRIRLFEYAKSWEGRRLIFVAISSEANIKRLDEIKAVQKRLADPRKTPAAEAKRLMGAQPATLGLAYGVHGNEISSPDAAMMTAYHLLASRGDAMIDGVLKNVVVLIDPLQNPDGRDRFVQNFRVNEGLEPDPNAFSAERAEPWPGGRSNHYYFDMNRDWHALTQPETLGRVRYLREWLPLVQVDLHEMGTNSTYFFTPGSLPMNPHLTKDQKDQMAWFGQNDAKWFDKFGWPYFTREVFDEFYPGYGASWPWFYGGMGMTYENASVRGLIARRSDETLYTYQESVKKHFVASIATCETTVARREGLFDSFYRYQVSAIEEGQKEPVKEYIIPRRGDTSAVDKLAQILAEHGVELRQSGSAFKSGGKDYPAGSYVISCAQPRKRFLRAVLDLNNTMEPDFLKEQERRRKKKLSDEIYDVTGWSLPLLFNVECVAAAEASGVTGPLVAPGAKAKSPAPAKAEVAYLVPWGSQAAGRFLTAALRADLKIHSANKPFQQSGRNFPAGTLILQIRQNDATIHEKVARLAASSGAEVIATNSSWVDGGINFGSNHVTAIRKPAILLAWDSPTSSASAGQARFVLERQYGYPVTAVRTSALGAAELNRFQVIILPDTGGGSYLPALGGPVAERINAWVRAGGVLIGIGRALSYLSNPAIDLLSIRQESLARDGGKPAEAAKPAAPATPAGPIPGKILAKLEDYEKAIQSDTELPDSVAGVIVKARVEPENWVTAGLPETLNVLVDGRAIWTPIKQDKGTNAVVFAGPEELLASGYLWEENRKQLAFKPFVIVENEGRGAVVGFTADPNYRAYMDGLNVVFLNAVFRFSGVAGRGGAEMEE